jgi:3-hydroxyisobutyrate dehydrogenase
VTHTIGVIGAGNMGAPLATAFATRHPVAVHDADSSVAASVVAALPGDLEHRRADSLAELASCDVIVAMLPTGRIVDECIWGSGLAGALDHDTLVIDMSSSEPNRTRDLAARLASIGVRFLDAPVSGGVRRAWARELTVIVGGEHIDVQRARPLLECVASAVIHVGGVGAGHAAKALNNLSSATGLLIALEVLRLAQQQGIDLTVMTDLLNRSTGRNDATENKLRQFVLSGHFNSGFAADLMLKDLRIARDLDGTDAPSLCGDIVSTWTRLAEGLPPGTDQTRLAEQLLDLAPHSGTSPITPHS